MNRRDRMIRDRLTRMDVPGHRPGFWDVVEAELADIDDRAGNVARDPAAGVVPMHVVPQEETSRRSPRTSPWIAASAAAALVLVLGIGTAFFFRPADDDATIGASSLPSIVGEGDVESLSGSTAPPSTGLLAASPWSAAPLGHDDVPAVLVGEWDSAENQGWCAALAPAALDAASSSAVARAADYPGGWAVAWDLAAGPGQNPDGTPCENCGRSAFGVAGSGIVQKPETALRQDDRIEWSDGSRADWGGEDLDPTAQRRVAEVVIPDQGCIYEVWSNLGDDHLVGLVDELRFVEGLDDGPVMLRQPGDPQDVVTLGDPPWDSPPVSPGTVDPVVFELWDSLDVEAPRLVLGDVGPELADASTRTWGQGVAWDNADGPGHTGSNEPCVNCGRGVVGLGWEPTVEPSPSRVDPPKRIEWADGSYAEYGSRLADPALPRDRITFFDPESGEPTVDALLATVHVAGVDGEVVVWTHLGEAHLLELIDRLRFVDAS